MKTKTSRRKKHINPRQWRHEVLIGAFKVHYYGFDNEWSISEQKKEFIVWRENERVSKMPSLEKAKSVIESIVNKIR